jgi:hypothetical protein
MPTSEFTIDINNEFPFGYGKCSWRSGFQNKKIRAQEHRNRESKWKNQYQCLMIQINSRTKPAPEATPYPINLNLLDANI